MNVGEENGKRRGGKLGTARVKNLPRVFTVTRGRGIRKAYSKRRVSEPVIGHVSKQPLSYPLTCFLDPSLLSTPYLAILLEEKIPRQPTSSRYYAAIVDRKIFIPGLIPLGASPQVPGRDIPPADIRIIAAEYSASLRRIKIQPEGCRLETSH